MPLHDRDTFESAYAGQAPWDIAGPQPALVKVADQMTGSILDVGCGTGENALYFASRAHNVTGIDFVQAAIDRANEKARSRGLRASFLVMDALALDGLSERFDTVLDSGLFHLFDDADRKRYVAQLAGVLKPGGKIFMICFSDEEPGTHGPRRVSRQEILNAFAAGWEIESVEPSRFDVRPDLTDITFSEGGPKAWFTVARRQAS